MNFLQLGQFTGTVDRHCWFLVNTATAHDLQKLACPQSRNITLGCLVKQIMQFLPLSSPSSSVILNSLMSTDGPTAPSSVSGCGSVDLCGAGENAVINVCPPGVCPVSFSCSFSMICCWLLLAKNSNIL